MDFLLFVMESINGSSKLWVEKTQKVVGNYTNHSDWVVQQRLTQPPPKFHSRPA
jgi:hypothetical protein